MKGKKRKKVIKNLELTEPIEKVGGKIKNYHIFAYFLNKLVNQPNFSLLSFRLFFYYHVYSHDLIIWMNLLICGHEI